MQARTLGPYRLDAELGSGGMGRVWRATVAGRAHGLEAGATVAVKVVHPHLLETAGFFKRFLREAEIGKSIVHDNVVRTFDCDSLVVDGERVDFLVMEHVEGRTLRRLLDELGRVPEELCRHVGREVARGLAAIHAAGAVHRDLKPENVLITADHAVKVMDLGVARFADEALRLSQTGAFVGSVEYAAPEQFRDADAVDARADLHALGVILYELATSQHPYRADDFRGVMRRVLDEAPRRPAEINPQLSPFFEEFVLRLLAKDAGGRFASADEMARVLDEGEASAWWKERAKAIRATTKRPLRRIRIPRETALHGRDAELARLRALFDAAKTGDGRVVLVDGEAGIGKSRLVDEFVGLLQREGEDVNFLFGSYPPGGAATASGAFSTAYREQFGDDGCAAWLTQTPILVPAFDALLRGETTPAGVEPLTKDSLQTVFVHATRNLAAERTTIVLIDDLHFAPEEGRALFAALAMAVPGHRILLVGTTRPGLDEKWLTNMDRVGAARLPLARLGPKDLVRMLADAFRSERLAEELGAKIALKSDGNPFFVFEILRGLRDGQFVTRKDDGTWATTRVIDEIQIPSSVLDLVQARVADLARDERNALDVASCLGFEFDPGLVAAVLKTDRIPLLQSLAHVEKAHRLVRSAGRRFVFDHHQVQEALYAGLPEMLREEYHAAIGAALEAASGAAAKEPKEVDGALCVDLVEHFFEGRAGGRAMRYLGASLDHLERAGLFAPAIRLADRALGDPALLERRGRIDLLLRTTDQLDVLGRQDDAAARLRDAAACADAEGDRFLRVAVRLAFGRHRIRVSRMLEAVAVLDEARAACRELGDRAGEARALSNLGLALKSLGRFSEAQAACESSIAIASAAGNRRVELAGTGNLGLAIQMLGRPEEAASHYERALAIAREIGDKRSEASSLGNLGFAFCWIGRFDDGLRHFRSHLAISRELGDRLGESNASGNIGGTLLRLGAADEARVCNERCRQLGEEIGDRSKSSDALANLGSVYDELDRPELARECVDRRIAISRETGDRPGVADGLAELGLLQARSGDMAAATSSLRQARSLAAELGIPGVELVAASRLAALQSEAPDALRTAVSALERLEVGAHVGQRMEARLLIGTATRDPSHLREAKRLLDHLVAHAPLEYRESMLTNFRLHREIVAAAKEHGLGDPQPAA